MILRASQFSERGAADRQRRREIERHLSLHGLAAVRPLAVPEGLGLCLARALPPLGPAFAAFAAYLGTRVDLLGAGECAPLADLAEQSDGFPPTPWDVVSQLLVDELGDAPTTLFAQFEERPFAVSLLCQIHRAQDRDGRPLEIRLIRPGIAEEIVRELPLLDLVVPFLPRDQPAAELLGDFSADLDARLDLARAAEDLVALAGGIGQAGLGATARHDRSCVVARVRREICTPRVLATDALAEPDEVLDLHDLRPSQRDALARELARIWWSELFHGRPPLEIDLLLGASVPGDPASVRLDIAYLRAGSAPSGSGFTLREYVEATAAHDPERAAHALLAELSPAGTADPEARRDLAKRLRQAVPRHEPSLSAGGETLAEHLLAHAAIARRCRLRPSPALANLWRGLFHVARATRRISTLNQSLRDPLREALEDLRWQGGFDQIRRFGEPAQLAAVFESAMSALANLPQRIERALDAAARPDRGAARRSATSRAENDTAAVGALGLAMVAVALIGGRLARLPGFSPAIESWTAAVFLLLGGWLLRILWSRR